MKKFVSIIFAIILLFSLSACSKIEETKSKEIAKTLIGYIEQGDYDSAADMFCDDKDVEDKSFSDLLNEFENETGLNLQSRIKIIEYTNCISKYSGTYGTIPCAFLDFQATIDGQTVVITVNMMEKNDNIECFFFDILYNDKCYQYICDDE